MSRAGILEGAITAVNPLFWPFGDQKIAILDLMSGPQLILPFSSLPLSCLYFLRISTPVSFIFELQIIIGKHQVKHCRRQGWVIIMSRSTHKNQVLQELHLKTKIILTRVMAGWVTWCWFALRMGLGGLGNDYLDYHSTAGLKL